MDSTSDKEPLQRIFEQKKTQIEIDHLAENKLGIAPTKFTYLDLRDHLMEMTEEQLAQEVQLLGPGGQPRGSDSLSDYYLEPVIALGTVQELMSDEAGVQVNDTHSAVDFANHPEQVVLLYDRCPFSEDGDTMYEMDEDEDGNLIMVGNKSGKIKKLGQ